MGNKLQSKGKKKEFSTRVELRLEDIEECLDGLRHRLTRQSSVQTYQRALMRLWEYLPEQDKTLTKESLRTWVEHLTAEYSVSSVNIHISAANVLLDYLGHRELTLNHIRTESELSREKLTRGEYVRALQQARKYKDGSSYFAIKIYVDTGIRSNDLVKITVDDVRTGELINRQNNGAEKKLRIPDCLQKELLTYRESEGITSGPVFRQAREPQRVNRVNINAKISKVFLDADLPMEKASPACLRDLYHRTHGKIEENINKLIDQAYDQFLDMEQAAVGWEMN